MVILLAPPHSLTPSPPHSEEDSTVQGVGVDMLVKDGKLDHLKNGPIYWVDSADVNPCIGEGSVTFFIYLFSIPFSSFLPPLAAPLPSLPSLLSLYTQVLLH